jgi:hypothetical protein
MPDCIQDYANLFSSYSLTEDMGKMKIVGPRLKKVVRHYLKLVKGDKGYCYQYDGHCYQNQQLHHPAAYAFVMKEMVFAQHIVH